MRSLLTITHCCSPWWLFWTHSLLLLASLLPTATPQAIIEDKVDFREHHDWADLKECVQCCLQRCVAWPGIDILAKVGCKTNACTCEGSTLGGAIPQLKEAVVTRCSNYNDATSAVSVLTAYCSDRGYTDIVNPVVATGAASPNQRSSKTAAVPTSAADDVAEPVPEKENEDKGIDVEKIASIVGSLGGLFVTIIGVWLTVRYMKKRRGQDTGT